jgi:chromate transporter
VADARDLGRHHGGLAVRATLLALFFAWLVLWPQATEAAPFSGPFDWFSLVITVVSFIALWRCNVANVSVIVACAAAGLA